MLYRYISRDDILGIVLNYASDPALPKDDFTMPTALVCTIYQPNPRIFRGIHHYHHGMVEDQGSHETRLARGKIELALTNVLRIGLLHRAYATPWSANRSPDWRAWRVHDVGNQLGGCSGQKVQHRADQKAERTQSRRDGFWVIRSATQIAELDAERENRSNEDERGRKFLRFYHGALPQYRTTAFWESRLYGATSQAER